MPGPSTTRSRSRLTSGRATRSWTRSWRTGARLVPHHVAESRREKPRLHHSCTTSGRDWWPPFSLMRGCSQRTTGRQRTSEPVRTMVRQMKRAGAIEVNQHSDWSTWRDVRVNLDEAATDAFLYHLDKSLGRDLGGFESMEFEPGRP